MPRAERSLNDLLFDLRRIEEHRGILTQSKIEKIYEQLMDELQYFIAKEYAAHSRGGVLTFDTLQSRSRQARFLQEITKRVDTISPILETTIMNMVEETYSNCFVGMSEAVRKAKNTAEIASYFKGASVRPEVIKRAFENNITKLTLPSVLERHRADLVYQCKQELTIGMLNGDRYDTMAKRIAEKCNFSMGKADNIVKTESHRNIECGFNDCADDISDSLEGSGFVYVSTWRTMGDERVRPQIRYKTKSGWKHRRSKNGADHVKMEGVTIIVGDRFKLEPTVYAKCPSMAGVARHDCRCRCFLEYDYLTIDEFDALDKKQINNMRLYLKYKK